MVDIVINVLQQLWGILAIIKEYRNQEEKILDNTRSRQDKKTKLEWQQWGQVSEKSLSLVRFAAALREKEGDILVSVILSP